MGVKRSEMRILTGYVEARLELIKERLANGPKIIVGGSIEEIRRTDLEAREGELTKLYDILGGYSD